MATLWSDLQGRFRSGSLLIKLIYINVALFLVVRLLGVGLTLFNVEGNPLLGYLELPASLPLLLRQPWSLLTYMVLHYDLMHLLFNMIWLFGFGQLFLLFFNEKQMGGLYLLGGLSGALFYILSYNLFPYFEGAASGSLLLGASASILAIVVATAVHAPNYNIRLMLIGNVPLKYVALATILIDALSITSSNAGGHLAHLGGAVMGALFALQLSKGKDITRWINQLIDGVVNLFKPRPPKMKVKRGGAKRESDREYNARKNREMKELDRILDKVKQSGYGGLSTEEKKQLFDASHKS